MPGAEQTRFADGDLKPESDYRYKATVEDRDGLRSDPVESDSIRSPFVNPQK